MLSMSRTIAIGVCVLALSSTATAQQSAEQTAVHAVAKIYQDFAAEAVIDTAELSILDLFSRPKAALARYLDDGLVALVMADRDCSRRKNEVCNLDFAPIWDSQDMVGVTVSIAPGRTADRVLVELKFPPKGEVRKLTYVMKKSPAGWRIHDIEYDSHESLVKMLKTKS
jgi:hypothetical protein